MNATLLIFETVPEDLQVFFFPEGSLTPEALFDLRRCHSHYANLAHTPADVDELIGTWLSTFLGNEGAKFRVASTKEIDGIPKEPFQLVHYGVSLQKEHAVDVIICGFVL